jgi:fructokinase
MVSFTPKVFGAGLIALDVVISADPKAPIRSYAGGTCGNVLAILAFLGWEAYPIARLNADSASKRVRSDLARWGVHLKHASCEPSADTPIIFQEIRRRRDGTPTHRFSWLCPRCGHWLPGFKAVTRTAIETVSKDLAGASVFFMDRLSRAALTLASEAARHGAVVMFEPSGRSDQRLMAEALAIAHVVKYADTRLNGLDELIEREAVTMLEIQTLGAAGLRYRHRMDKNQSTWRHLDAVPAPRLADTCGSGDWCSAGLLSKLAAEGLSSLMSADIEHVEAALRHGQALAAWNCGFEGARGGMYGCDRAAFDKQIVRLLDGVIDAAMPAENFQIAEEQLSCPACASTAS